MSVKLVLVRFNAVISACEGKFRRYAYVETLTTGWQSGSNLRSKRFKDCTAVFAYLNKLHIHGWLDDDSYEAAWVDVMALEHAHPFSMSDFTVSELSDEILKRALPPLN